jgi:F-type H+-transporting ATPase subunit b
LKFFLAFSISALALFAEEAHGAQDLGASKWIHFAVLAALLVYGWFQLVAPMLRKRGAEIREELETARQRKAESDARVAAIESRLGNLPEEIEAFRVESRQMIASEAERIRTETEQAIARVGVQAEAEIQAIAKAARGDLKREAARLAVEIAESQLARGISREAHMRLLNGFMDDLRKAGV